MLVQRLAVHAEVTAARVFSRLVPFDLKDAERIERRPGLAANVVRPTSLGVTYSLGSTPGTQDTLWDLPS